MSTITCTIGGTDVSAQIKMEAFQIMAAHQQRSILTVVVEDNAGTLSFSRGQEVVFSDSVQGVLYTGFVQSSQPIRLGLITSAMEHTVTCMDNQYGVDKRTNTKPYADGWLAGDIVADSINTTLQDEGISGQYALSHDSMITDFSDGTLTNTTSIQSPDGSSGVGQLQLAPSGTDFTYSESTTANFSTGVLTGCTATNNTLVPNTQTVIKMQAQMTSSGLTAAATWVKVWSGSYTVLSNAVFNYDMYVDPSSPQVKFGIDLFFSDGTTLRDNQAFPDTNDFQDFAVDPASDTTGLSSVSWYSRAFKIPNQVGKTLSYVAIGCAGTMSGTYKAYFRNVSITTGTGGPVALTIFSSSLNVNPPQQLQSYGYTSTVVSTIPAYDLCTTTGPSYGAKAYRTTSAISISSVKIIRTSTISWVAIEPTGTQLIVAYSLDGNAYTPCVNGFPLPNLPSGLDLTGISIYLQYQFYALSGGSVELAPTLESVQLTLYTSYAATKTDLSLIADTSSGWNAGTYTNTTVSSNAELTLKGGVHNWLQAPAGGEAFFFTSPNGTGTQNGAINRVGVYFNMWNQSEAHLQLTAIPQLQNGTAELDVKIDNTFSEWGILYRTTAWQNNPSTWGYLAFVSSSAISLGHGNNAGSGSGSFTSISSVSITPSSGNWHRLKAIFSGSSHQVFLDDIRYINATDSAYTSAGYLGTRGFNGSNGTNNSITFSYNNFGVAQSLSGTWTSPATSMTSAGTYQTSAISWRDKSASYNGLTNYTILVEASYDNGSTYATCTNGSALPTLTTGTSLSGKTLKIRITLTTSTAGSLPAVDNLQVYIVGGYSSSGTRTTIPLGNDNNITRTVASGWGTAFDSQTWAKTGTGTTSVGSGEANITNTTGDVHMKLGSKTWTDEEGIVRFSLSNSSTTAGMELRYTDSNNFYRLAFSTTAATLSKKVAGVTTTLATTTVALATSTVYELRFRVIGSDPVLLYGKVWLASGLEPGTKAVNFVDERNPQWTITAAD